jgi:hypothetical protein
MKNGNVKRVEQERRSTKMKEEEIGKQVYGL